MYTVSGMLPMGSAIILLPFYIAHLSTADFGALTIYLAFALLVQIIVTFSFDTSVYIHFHEFRKDPQKLSQFIASSYIFMLMIGVFLLVIFLLSGEYLFHLFFEDRSISFHPYGTISVFTGLFMGFFKVYTSLLQTRQKPEVFFRSNLVQFSMIAGFTIVGLYIYPNTLAGPVGGRLLAALISGGLAVFSITREFGVHFNRQLLQSSFSFNFFSFVYQLQQWMMNYFDRILLAFFLPLTMVGVYGFMMNCLVIIELIINSLYSSFAPRIIPTILEQEIKSSSPEINRYFNGLAAVSMILVSGAILFFPVLIEGLIEKPNYRLAVAFIPYAALVYLLKPMRLYFGIPFGILKYTKPLPFIYAAVSVLKIGVLVLLVRYIGLYGAIVASLAGFILEVILLYTDGRKRFVFTFNWLKLVFAPVALMFLVLVVEPLFDPRDHLYIHIFYFMASLGLLVWAFRREVRYINPFKILGS